MNLPRYAPEFPLPPYSYVPGLFPHPVSDPRGHMAGQMPEVITLQPGEAWQAHPQYLAAIDLFNHGYYWEAHEAWEGLWHALGRTGPEADFLKGLIKLAAAGVKAREGSVAGLQRHALRAAELFRIVRTQIDDDTYGGLALAGLIAQASEIAARASELVNNSREPVLCVLGFGLVLA
jgi:predicted metal-dependent hydrolase